MAKWPVEKAEPQARTVHGGVLIKVYTASTGSVNKPRFNRSQLVLLTALFIGIDFSPPANLFYPSPTYLFFWALPYMQPKSLFLQTTHTIPKPPRIILFPRGLFGFIMCSMLSLSTLPQAACLQLFYFYCLQHSAV